MLVLKLHYLNAVHFFKFQLLAEIRIFAFYIILQNINLILEEFDLLKVNRFAAGHIFLKFIKLEPQ